MFKFQTHRTNGNIRMSTRHGAAYFTRIAMRLKRKDSRGKQGAHMVSQGGKSEHEPQEVNPGRGQGLTTKYASSTIRRYWRAGTQRRGTTGPTQRERGRLGKEEANQEDRRNGEDRRPKTNDTNLLRSRVSTNRLRRVREGLRAEPIG